jgi:hypothetical protein
VAYADAAAYAEGAGWRQGEFPSQNLRIDGDDGLYGGLRYDPAAREGETIDASTGHIGFRCVLCS